METKLDWACEITSTRFDPKVLVIISEVLYIEKEDVVFRHIERVPCHGTTMGGAASR